MRVLGFDPGTARLGFGLILGDNGQFACETCGVIETTAESSRAERLAQIQADLEELLSEYKPDLVVVEELFFAQNVTTGMAVAEARGVILATVARQGCKLLEVKPNTVKLSLCGHGHAEKEQVQRMVQVLLRLPSVPRPDDAADALAIALTGAQICKLPG